jgi:hypothetical protein
MKFKTIVHHSFVNIFFFLLIINQIYGQPKETKTDSIYLIIVSDDYFNSNVLDTFISFREQDFSVQVIKGTNIGTSKDDYRNYIRNLMPDYVLLVGKYGDFPVHTLPYPKEVESYNYYVASSTSGHPNQDIPLGLFFAENYSELNNIINKTISYENNYTTYPKEYYGHAGSIAALPPWPVEFNEEILTEMQTRYFGPESYSFTLATANDSTPNDVWTDINMINNGIRYMIYHGHGNIMKWSFGLGVDGLSQLTNTIYPIVFSFACLTGTFSGGIGASTYDCFAQKITTAEHGAVAFLGSYNESGKGMNQILEGTINGLFNDTIIPRIGNVFLYAYANTTNTNTVNLYYPTVTAIERERAAWQFHLFGDPALKIRDDETSNQVISQDNIRVIIYPNPTNGIVTINSNAKILEIAIFSLNGEKLFVSNNSTKIDLSDCPKGVYYMSLKIKSGVFYRKIIRI